ncbi:bacitracin ABC transporter ATP-binding protein [Vallitalea longa]|uniref:Bacitracin ABC transporter ATP-binding protein n=1 Tax=Vallitalea longa TaxID=2936439 RepID=A0A9W5Y7I5_9FIRM|nr:ABC transporter ATP-binding protein [Vallitalea longa]GKX28267.1 bacitracin ABC transporter ATP-binding protein [Vallitalea longa]
MKKIIEVKNVDKHFKENHVLKGIDFSVDEGEIFGFLGPNGAGKTTTIKILTNQLLPSDGEIKLFGKNIRLLKNKIFKGIGILSDNSGVYERISVYENLKVFADIHNINKKEIDILLKKVDLIDHKKKIVKKLSRGMKQRLILARTLIHKPKLLFLDEPTSSLDPGTSNEIHKLLNELKQEGTTIFLTTHRMEEADKLCDRVAFLNNGEIVLTGNPEKLKLQYAENIIEVLLENDQKMNVSKDVEGLNDILKWMQEGKVLSIHSKEPNLEEIFLRLTGRDL